MTQPVRRRTVAPFNVGLIALLAAAAFAASIMLLVLGHDQQALVVAVLFVGLVCAA